MCDKLKLCVDFAITVMTITVITISNWSFICIRWYYCINILTGWWSPITKYKLNIVKEINVLNFLYLSLTFYISRLYNYVQYEKCKRMHDTDWKHKTKYSKQSLCLSLIDGQEVFRKTNTDTYHSRQRQVPKPKISNKCLKQIQYHPSRPTPRPRRRPYFPRLRSTLGLYVERLMPIPIPYFEIRRCNQYWH